MALKVNYQNTKSGQECMLNFYIPAASSYAELQQSLQKYLFEEHKLPRNELRVFYADMQDDKIEVINNFDLEVFSNLNKNTPRILYVTPKFQLGANKTAQTATMQGPPLDDPANFVIHENVKCDACEAGPIVGFRYKCIECPNFDLCQNCETQHKHAEHMMLRMPSANSPTCIQAWLSPGVNPHHRRSFAIRSPKWQFVGAGNPVDAAENLQQATNEAKPSGGSPHKSRHERKHERRQMRQNLFTHFYDMMQDMAEGGATRHPEQAATDAESAAKTTEQAAAAKLAAEDAAKIAATVAQNAAQTAHEVASKVTPLLASAATANILAPEPMDVENINNAVHEAAMQAMGLNISNNKNAAQNKENKQNGTASPGTPPSTPETNTTDNSRRASAQTATTPVLNLENLSQFIDPNFMKMGIDILNNFNGMFAKMIDPNAADVAAPSNTASSTSSADSSVNAQDMTAASSQPAANSAAASSQPAANSTAAADTVILEDDDSSDMETTAAAVKPLANDKSGAASRAQSEEGDWQMIDKQNEAATAAATAVDVSPSTSSSSSSSSSGVFVANQAAAAAGEEMNYAKLSNDLQAHIAAEKKAASPPRPEEKRAIPVYHTDKRINDAVHAMMAMGFSNEGAYLTQLLDTVDGNIAKALDLMNATQGSMQ